MFEALTKELANRRCIIFLGSGASASSSHKTDPVKKVPTWGTLLTNLNLKISIDQQPDIAALIGNKKFLEAAEKIRMHINPADY